MQRTHKQSCQTCNNIISVVILAPLGTNQSERSKFYINQSEGSIWHTWPKWRQRLPNMVIMFTWPHGVKNRRIYRKTPIVAWWLDACAVRTYGFALRSHVNAIVGSCADRQNSPQVPRIRVSLFSRRPTAHAQSMKRSPRPLHEKKPQTPRITKNPWKTHCMEVNFNLF